MEIYNLFSKPKSKSLQSKYNKSIINQNISKYLQSIVYDNS